MMTAIEVDLNELQVSLQENPFQVANHNRIIALLRIKGDANGLFEAYANKLNLFMLTESEIAEWLSDIQSGGISDKLSEFYTLVLEDYPIVSYWCNYLKAVPEDQKSQLISKALSSVSTDFANGSRIWDVAFQHFEHQKVDPNTILQLHLKRLSTPHKLLSESFSDTSSFISANFEAYEKEILKANAVYSETLKQQRYVERYEISLLDEPKKETWISYLTNVAKFSNGNVQPLETLFARFISDGSLGVLDSEKVWLAYIDLVRSIDLDLLLETLSKYVRKYYNSPLAYACFVRHCSLFDNSIELLQMIMSRIQMSKLLNAWEYDGWSLVASSILTTQLQLVFAGNVDQIESLYSSVSEFFTTSMEFANTDHSVAKLALSILGKLEELPLATDLIQKLLSKFSNSTELWLFCSRLYSTHGSVDQARANFENSTDHLSEIDKPDVLLDEWILFEQLNGSFEGLSRAISLKSKFHPKFKLQEVEKVQQLKDNIDHKNPTRSRENLSIKVSNLNSSTTRQNILDYFEECGTIRNISLSPQSSCILEFSAEQDVFTALTKNKKLLDGNNIKVERHLNSTIFVSNFPPSMSQDQLKMRFAEVGVISSIRFPQQKDTRKSRRFCYIEFSNPQSAVDSVTLLNGSALKDDTDKEYILKVAISQPKLKEQRHVPISERKIRVSNLPFGFDETSIRGIFKSFPIEQVVIPKINMTRPSTQHNDGVAIVVLEKLEDIESAAKLNGTQVEGRKIEVTKHAHSSYQNQSQQHEHLSAYDFDELSTLGFINVDKTLTPEQIKLFFIQEIGVTVNKVETYPSNLAALIEFGTPAESGKANMIVPFKTLGSKVIEVTSKSDVVNLLKNKAISRPVKRTSLMIPSSVQRKKKKSK